MLETVIQKKNVDGLLRFEPTAFDEAVFADSEGNATLEAKLHQLDFVTRAICPVVTAAENGNAFSIGEEFLSEPNYHGSLAGTADCQVANANDRCLQTSPL
jgi:hypothetical protein